MKSLPENLIPQESRRREKYLPISGESRRIWHIIKSSLPLCTRKDLADCGHPILCDPFAVILPWDARTRLENESEMFSYCVLFSTRLAFFCPRHLYDYKEYPNDQTRFVLVGLIDVQRDISNPRIRTPHRRNSTESSISRLTQNKLEIVTTIGGIGSQSFKSQVCFVSWETTWNTDDRTADWEKMLRELLKDPCATWNHGDRGSFLLTNVITLSISTN